MQKWFAAGIIAPCYPGKGYKLFALSLGKKPVLNCDRLSPDLVEYVMLQASNSEEAKALALESIYKLQYDRAVTITRRESKITV